MTTSFTQGLKPTSLAMACLLAAPVMAQVTVHVRADLPAVNQLSKSSYGSGVIYKNADLRVMFENQYWDGTAVNSLASYNMLKSMNVGMYRFPGGDPSFLYRWDDPCGSVKTANEDPNQCVEYLRMADIQKYLVAPTLPQGASYRAPLGAQAMYQVNTIHAWNKNTANQTVWHTVYQRDDWLENGQWKSKPVVENGKYKIHPDGLANVAAAAAAWVKKNREDYPAAQQAQYWEIGNEDWVRWTPEQYAEIFIAFADAMIAENGGTTSANGTNAPLKLIAQTTTIVKDYTQLPSSQESPNNLAINQTAGDNWLYLFINELERRNFSPAKIYGVAPHPYLDGNRSPDVNVRALTMFRKADGGEMLDNYYVVANVNGYFNIGGVNAAWKTLATEYNVVEFLEKDLTGNDIPSQNKAHAMVLADWTASMLARGVEKVMPHSLESDPRMGMFLYRNGGTLAAPKITAPGAAFSRVASALQGAMYTTENNAADVNFTGVNGSTSVKGLSSYSAISGNTLNVLLINRNLTQAQTVDLKLTGSKQFVPGGTLKRSAFGENRSLLDSNSTAAGEIVIWGANTFASYYASCFDAANQPKTCVPTTTVPAGGMVHVQVPLQ